VPETYCNFRLNGITKDYSLQQTNAISLIESRFVFLKTKKPHLGVNTKIFRIDYYFGKIKTNISRRRWQTALRSGSQN
jgi:hypothetical protein